MTSLDPGTAERPPGPPWRIIAVVAVVGAVAVAVVLGVLLAATASERDDLRTIDANRRQVQLVASAVTEALFGFDHTDLDAGQTVISDLATGSLAEEYRQAFSGPIREQLETAEARGVVNVTDLYVGDIGDQSATVVVVMDLVVDSNDGRRTTFDNFLVVSLVRTTGGWRADGVQTVNSGVDPELLAALTDAANQEGDS
ncbi:MAG TPA: hypothetical protein VGA13_11450 [Acidimicrobiales bacterium]|jgi:hypothetical protein